MTARYRKIVFALIFVFVVVNFATRHSGWTNPASRYAFMCALVGRGTFFIDGAEKLTVDWAQTPDGHYYSNKAPGAGFAAAPIFWLMQKYDQASAPPDQSAFETCVRSSITARLFLLSLILQVGGAIFLMFYCLRFLKDKTEGARIAFVATFLLGSTAACLMNTYFGHALAAVFLLAALVNGLSSKMFWSSFFWGWALLTDYAVLWTLPGFAWMWFQNTKSARKSKGKFLFLIFGAILPGALWFWYHTASFGNPWSLPNKFQNPEFIEKQGYALWGILKLFPDPNHVFSLLFGPSRGILWTQPWVLLLCVVTPFVSRKIRDPKTKLVMLICLTGLAGMIVMNASFNGWHGGLSPGPRYLSPIFPLFSLWLAMIWDALSVKTRKIFVPLIAMSMLFTILALFHGIVMDERPLWLQLFSR